MLYEVITQLTMARTIPGKEEFHGLTDWFATMLERTGVTLRLTSEVNAEMLQGFDA